MNLTDDEILRFQMGSPVFLEDICAVYPLTLREIVTYGYTNFRKCLSVLIADKPVIENADDEIKKVLEALTDFQYLLFMTNIDQDVRQTVHDAFQLFTHESIIISIEPAQIVIGPPEEKHLLVEEKFYDLQRLLKRAFFIEQEGEEIIISSSDDLVTRRLKEQMRRNREKLRRAKAAKHGQGNIDNLCFSDLIGSLTINHCGLNMTNIWDITYYTFHDQLKRMGWRDQFDINNRAAMAGAKINKSQLKHWMRSIASSDKN